MQATLPAGDFERRTTAPWLWNDNGQRTRKISKIFEEALRHHRAGRIDDALELYRQVLALDPVHGDASINSGAAFVTQGRIEDAIGYYERGLAAGPAQPAVHYNFGNALARAGRIDDAIFQYRHAIALQPDYAEACNNLGNMLMAKGLSDDAAVQYRRAIALRPGHAGAHNNLGNVLRDQGLFNEAMRHFDHAIAFDPSNAEAHYNRAEIRTFRAGDEDLKALESLAGTKELPSRQKPFVHFALAKALEDIGDYPRAFTHLRWGNGFRRSAIHYDERATLDLFTRISTVFDRGVMERLRGSGDPSEAPVFVLGMPRSGSSLIEQILASHPQIHGAGEREDLIDVAGGGFPESFPEKIGSLAPSVLREMGRSYVNRLAAVAGDRTRIVDKLPANFLRIGLIRLILPNARIIHTMRDPLDTCVSCYSKLFTAGQDFSYDLGETGRYYRAYAGLMEHWRSVLAPGAMLEVAYEDVVNDLEGQARRLIEYCGLRWDDRCLSFHKNTRPVKTASSVQVRRPISRSSLHRWRRYEAELGPLLDALGDAVPGKTARFATAA